MTKEKKTTTPEKATTNLFHKYETNKDAEIEGVWIDDFEPGVDFKIARFNVERTEKYMDELRRPYKKLLKAGGRIPADKADEMLIDAMSKYALVDWRGVIDQDGKPMPYSPENAYTLLKILPEIREKVLKLSLDGETYNKKALEDARKN